jgi:hypothetical protein
VLLLEHLAASACTCAMCCDHFAMTLAVEVSGTWRSHRLRRGSHRDQPAPRRADHRQLLIDMRQLLSQQISRCPGKAPGMILVGRE